MKNRTRTLAVGLIVAAATVALAAPGGSSASRAPRKVFKGSVAAYAAHSSPAGRARGEVPIAVALRWRHAPKLTRFTNAVSDPNSPSYRQFLSAGEFRARYSPSPARVAAVQDFLRSRGFHMTGVSQSRMLVDAVGSVRNAERAFHTKLRRYHVGGHVLRAAAKPVSMPGSVARGVVGVIGLSENVNHHFAPPPPAFVNARPCSHYWAEKFANNKIPHAYGHAQPFAPCGYDAQDLQSAYGVDEAIGEGFDGSGQSIAIIDAFSAPTIVADVNEYSSRHGLPDASITQTQMPGTCHVACASAQGWYGEETLDLEAAHSMAPDAAIEYYGAVDAGGKALLDALVQVIDNNTASVVTNSYGSLGENLARPGIQAQEQAFKQAIAQGIGVYFSSGDNGDEHTALGFASTDYPASSPRVTAVGGTSLGVGPTGNRSFEIGWGTKKSTLVGKPGSSRAHWEPSPPGDFLYGSGGGTSRLFSEPRYQLEDVPAKFARRFGGRNRVVPDISMDGDPTTGMLVGETQTFPDGSERYGEYRIGGTSLSSPLLAGYMADAGEALGGRVGFANPAFYDIAGNPGFANVIRDTRPAHRQIAALRNDFNNGVDGGDGTTISLRSFDLDTTLHTKKGYDTVTGLGSPGAHGALIFAFGGPCNAAAAEAC
jgi:subtilase family serine protease